MRHNFLLLVLLVVGVAFVYGDRKHHKYQDMEAVELFVNTVGPFANPTETYQYYKLPFCQPETLVKKKQSMKENLDGDRAVLSDYKIAFKGVVVCKVLSHLFLQSLSLTENCVIKPLPRRRSKSSARLLRNTIPSRWSTVSNILYPSFVSWVVFADDLPIFGFIGTIDPDDNTKHYLIAHLDFHIEYNGNQVHTN